MDDLDRALDAVSPDVKKWATVVVVSGGNGQAVEFSWHDYRDTGHRQDFWPASCIKLYAAVAALEILTELGLPLDVVATFEHRTKDGAWVLDAARTMKEMLGEVFRRSSNEDYTLLLRLVGIDRINTRFLVPEKGFAKSALMRGYVTARPWAYVREEPQRITLSPVNGAAKTLEHTWSGVFYAEQRGCTLIDAKTGNVTTTREMADCLRRVMYHESLPENERYRLGAAQLAFLRTGGDGWTGLETKAETSGASAWRNGVEKVFPNARFFHKSGLISNFALEIAAVDDLKDSGKRFLLAPAAAAGLASKPHGESIISEMSRVIAEWVRGQ